MSGRIGWLGGVTLALACGPIVAVDDTGTTSNDPTDPSTTIGNTTVVTTSPQTTVGSGPGTTVGTSDSITVGEVTTEVSSAEVDDGCNEPCGCDFIGECWDLGPSIECDVWSQDCPEGEKCMPWANDGGPYWNATRCSPVTDRSVGVGEPCLVEGSYMSGIDQCELGAQCLWVDPKTNMGVCAANCAGNEANPLCADPATTCDIAFDGTIHLCLPNCDPLLQDCIEGASCAPTTDGEAFVCVQTLAPTLGEHDACQSAWDCLPGLVCLSADLDPDCMGDSCCFAFCDLMLGDVYCETQTCTPWFADGQAPPGLEDVGICTG